MTKIYGNYVKDALISGGYRRLYIDIPDAMAIRLFTDIGIPTANQPVPVFIESAEPKEDNIAIAEPQTAQIEETKGVDAGFPSGSQDALINGVKILSEYGEYEK